MVATLMVDPRIIKIQKPIPVLYLTYSHTNILFCHREIAFPNNFLFGGHRMVHPRIMKIHKNLPGDTPSDFQNFSVIG